MRRRDTYWSLYHQKEKRQLNDLKTDHVEAIFEALPKKDHVDWVVWKEGFRSWKPFHEFPQLLIGLRQSTPPAIPDDKTAPIPPRVSASGSGSTSGAPSAATPGREINLDEKTSASSRLGEEVPTSVDFSIDDDTALGERDTRFPKRWEVRIYGELKVHMNQTVNVSMHGMQVRDPVPDQGLTNYFNVELRAGETKIPLLCSRIENPDGSPSFRIRIESCEYPNALQTALLAQ